MVNAPMPKSRTKVAWGSISASEGSDQNLDSLMSQWGVKLLGIYDVLEKTLLSGEFFSWNHNPIGRWNFGTWRSSHCRCSVVLKHCRSQRRMNAVVVDHNSNVSHISMCTTFDAFFPVDPHVSPRKKKKTCLMIFPWFIHGSRTIISDFSPVTAYFQPFALGPCCRSRESAAVSLERLTHKMAGEQRISHHGLWSSPIYWIVRPFFKNQTTGVDRTAHMI